MSVSSRIRTWPQPSPIAAATKVVLTARPGIIIWIMAIYLGAVVLLEGTIWWRFNTYIAYLVVLMAIFSLRINRVVEMPEFWLVIAVVLWWWLSSLFSEYPSISIISVVYLTKIYLTALILLIHVDTLPKIRLCFHMMMLGGIVLAVGGLALGGSVLSTGGPGIQGFTGNPNSFGGLLSDAFLASLVLLPMASKKSKILIFIYSLLALLGVAASGSRASAIAIITAMGAYFFLEYVRNFRHNWKWVVPLVLLVVLVMAVINFIPNSPVARRFEAGLTEKSAAVRLEMFPFTLKLVAEKPLIGYGPGLFPAYNPWKFSYSHSSLLELLFIGGIPGFALYLTILVLLWRRMSMLVAVFRKNDKLRMTLNAARAVFIAMMAYGIIGMSFERKSSTGILILMIAFTSRLSMGMKKDRRLARKKIELNRIHEGKMI